MTINFADRTKKMKASEIREAIKLAANPDMITFSGGLPAPELFPVDEMKTAACAVLDEMGAAAMQYSATEGFPPLREKIAERMGSHNKVQTSSANILITNGSQQGLDFSGKLFLNEGDVVLVESPSYMGAFNAFKAYQPRFIEVPTDDDGMIPEDLEHILSSVSNIKMIYVIPDFQNPTGRTWSLERRKAFMEIIRRYEIPVIEDNPYGDLRFEGETLPSLKSMDTNGLVVFLGSFSKILAPGYRVGWICAEGETLDKYIVIKQGADLQASTIAQMEISKYMELFDLNLHIEKVKGVYKKRRDLMLAEMKRTFPPSITYTHPQGGLFTWVRLPDGLSSRAVLDQCIEQNVSYISGSAFFPESAADNTFRLNYSNMSEDRIVQGIQRLGAVLQQLCE